MTPCLKQKKMNNSTDPTNDQPGTNVFTFYNNHSHSVIIDQVVTPIFYVIGLPANPLSAYIWLNRKTRANNSSAIYLGALSISHVIFLLFHILQELRYAWDIKTYDGHISCEIFNMLFCIPQYLAPLLVLGFTVERYIAVCHPFKKARYCTVKRAEMVVVCLLVTCLLISTLQAYFWTYDEVHQICNHRPEIQNGDFLLLWTWLTELLLFGVAPLAALIFNILVIREIHILTSGGPAHTGSSGGSSQASTATLLCVSFYLICTWLPYTVIYSLSNEFPIGDFSLTTQEVQRDATWQRHFVYNTIRVIVQEITLSNSACYFFIYYATGKHFRDSVHEILCPKKCIATTNRNHLAKQYIAVSKSSHLNGTVATCV
ncbi:probable G-protein coupled receptor 139 isoform X1 [Biomphalaria glabrata]|uniref:Probable G-protein coupled receptor 139 isoform X1 n=1 Tax=Biomphalaria glabrata TaxID=6526 RepID=A0A9W3AJB1_BIOGL|nr:probable G-protein coupled receptor 139 isoform X1 [Biomphalaria glabrata]